MDTGDTPVDTGQTPGDTATTADSGAPGDTGAPFCTECTGAAGLAGEEGGTPCDTGAAGGAAWGVVAVFASLLRRRGR